MTTWRCPFCGGRDIEVYGQQNWAVERIVSEGEEADSYAQRAVGDFEITGILCLTCNAENKSDQLYAKSPVDKDWHMTDREWVRECKARHGDTLYNLAMDK